jgi:hypothetical protein
MVRVRTMPLKCPVGRCPNEETSFVDEWALKKHLDDWHTPEQIAEKLIHLVNSDAPTILEAKEQR